MEQKPKRSSYEFGNFNELNKTKIKCSQWEYLIGG